MSDGAVCALKQGACGSNVAMGWEQSGGFHINHGHLGFSDDQVD
jgi:hypothetical protein